MLLLVLDVLLDHRFIQPHGAYALAARPKRSSIQASTHLSEVTVDPNGTLSFQESHRVRNAVLRWNTQQQMNVVQRCIALHQFDVLLPAKVAENLPDLCTKTSKELAPPVFWNNHNVVFAVPLHMGLATPVFHLGSSCAPRGLPQEDPFYTPGTAEPSEYSPAELVVYDHELSEPWAYNRRASS